MENLNIERGMSFGLAIEAMKKGYRVTRIGWNGKDMFIYLVPGQVINKSQLRDAAAEALKDTVGDVTLCSHIDMKSADGSIVIGWLASQTDILTNDWQVLP